MSDKIRAIATRYAGCEFRSRLEARWAVFFDALGIEWEYEPEGFETSIGNYLPDFRIRLAQVKDSATYRQYFEVKPESALSDARHLAFTEESGEPLIVASGMPRDHADQLRADGSALRLFNGKAPAAPCAFVSWSGRSHFYGHHYCALGDQRHWCQEDFTLSLDGRPHLAIYCDGGDPPIWCPAVDAAYAAARSARFEFGDAIIDARTR